MGVDCMQAHTCKSKGVTGISSSKSQWHGVFVSMFRFFFFLLVLFETEFLCAALAVLELCRPGWPHTHRFSCICSWVLGLKVCTITSRLLFFYIKFIFWYCVCICPWCTCVRHGPLLPSSCGFQGSESVKFAHKVSLPMEPWNVF